MQEHWFSGFFFTFYGLKLNYIEILDGSTTYMILVQLFNDEKSNRY